MSASTNQAVDTIARRMKKGIPTVYSGTVIPNMMRFGRHKLQYKDLTRYSYREMAMECELRLRKEADPVPLQASSTAKKRAVGETVVFLVTNSTAGSAAFRDLKAGCNVVCSDEAANSSEAESVIPITEAESGKKLLVVHVGDPKQLPVMATSKHHISSITKETGFQLTFPGNVQFRSLFERLLDGARAPCVLLNEQYRSHPGIGNIQTPPFYHNLVKHPHVLPSHISVYTDPRKTAEGSFAPFTIRDMKMCKNRREQLMGNRKGQYINDFEAREVNGLLKRIWSCI